MCFFSAFLPVGIVDLFIRTKCIRLPASPIRAPFSGECLGIIFAAVSAKVFPKLDFGKFNAACFVHLLDITNTHFNSRSATTGRARIEVRACIIDTIMDVLALLFSLPPSALVHIRVLSLSTRPRPVRVLQCHRPTCKYDAAKVGCVAYLHQ